MGRHPLSLWHYCWVLFFSHFFTWLSEFLLIPISNRYSYKIRQAFQAKMDRLPLSFFDRQTYGEILSKGTNDVDSVSRSLQGILSSVLSSLLCLWEPW